MTSSEKPGTRGTSFWTPMRTSLSLLVVALLASLGLSSCNSSTDNIATANTPKGNMTVNGANTAPKVNAPPAMLTATALDTPLETIDGKSFKLADLKGKVLQINLWATWCGPCRSEVPELVKFQSEYGPRGFEVIGLDIDPDSDSPEDVRDFMKEFKINYKVAFVKKDLATSLMRGGNIPQSLIVARDGRIALHFTGFDRVGTPAKMRAAIEKALQEGETPK